MKPFHLKTIVSLCLIVLLTLSHFAQAQNRPDLVWMRGGSLVQDVQRLTYSPDGKWLASGDARLTKLWRTSDGALMHTFNVSSPISSFVFSPDSRHLYTVGGARLRFISIPDCKIEQTIAGSANAVDVSPDGQTLAVADGQGLVRIFDTKTGTLRTSFTAHNANVASVAFSPDGKLLATGSADKNIKLWNVGSWTLQSTWAGHTSEVLSLTFSPDGALLASCDRDHAYIRNAVGQPISDVTGLHWLAIRFSPDGSVFAVSGTYNGYSGIRIYTTKTAQFITQLSTIPLLAIAFPPSGGKIATSNPQIIEREIASGTSGKSYGTSYSAPVARIAVSPDNNAVAYLCDHAVDILNPVTGSLIRNLAYAGYPANIFDVQYSGDGQTVFLGKSYYTQSGYGGSTSYWIEAYRASDGLDLGWRGTLSDPPHGFAISPHDPIYVTANGYPGGVYEVHNTSDGSLIRTLPRPGFWGTAQLLFSPNGEFFAEFSDAIELFRVSDWTDVDRLPGANAGAFSPDSRLLVTGGSDGTLNWWDTRTGALLHTVHAHTKPIDFVAFSPDGGTLSTGGRDGTLAIWETDNAALLTRYDEEVTIFGNGSNDYVSLSYSQDGKFLYYGRADGTLCAALNPYRNAVFPNHGGNTDKTTIRIVPPDNFSLVDGTTVKLTADGQPDIVPISTTVESQFVVSATFDLRGAPLGKRNVVITLPTGETRAFTQGFTIEQGDSSQFSAEILGRATIRGGREYAYSLIISNRSNVDAEAKTVWFEMPNYFHWRLDGEALENASEESQGENTLISIDIPAIGAYDSLTISIWLTAPDSGEYAHRQFQLRFWTTASK